MTTLGRTATAVFVCLFFTLPAGRAAAQGSPPPPPASPPGATPEPPAEPPAPPPDSTAQPPPEATTTEPAPAPAPAVEPDGQVETIVVTGSRLRRKDLNTPAPVTIMTRQQWEDSGKLTLGDFLQSMPEQGNAPNFQLNNGGATYSADGATRINLRSLGVTRTLVLVNGKRMVSSGLGASPGVDLNSIPAAAVERVEVLKDGGSAIYGSDAIAGVVNIITRKKYSGTEAAAEYGVSGHGDAQTFDLTGTTGRTGEFGNFLFSAGYFKQTESWLRDRDWSKNALTYDYVHNTTSPGGSFRTPQGTIGLPSDANGNPLPACLANTLCKGLVDSDPSWAADSFIRDPSAPLGWRIMQDADTYNFAADNYLSLPSTRVQVYSSGDTKSKLVRGYYETSYVQRNVSENAAPMPLNPGDYTVGGGSTPISVSPDSIYNPFGVPLPFAGRRLVEFGNRTYSQELGTFRIIAGLDGTLPDTAGPLNGWYWDAWVNYGRTEGTFTTDGAIRNSRIADAVGPSMLVNGVPTCVTTPGDASTAIPGCVPINLFGGPNNGSIDPAQIANLGFQGTSRAFDSLISAGITANGDLFELPSGRKAAFGVGYEFRRQEGAQIADPIAASGDSADFNFQSTQGDFNVHEIHGEVDLPIISNVPGIKDLELSAAGRYVNYDTFGDNFSGKLGLRYTPISDFTVRGTYSTAFRAPSIAELFLGQSETAPTASDPCVNLAMASTELAAQCRATGVPAAGSGDAGNQELSHVGGNSNLKPETAKVFTAGVVVQPHVLEDFSITVDYYHIDVDDLIGTLGVPAILAGCYPGASGTPNQAYCSLVTRAAGSGRILFVSDVNQNVGQLSTAGIDFAIRYGMRTKVGRFNFIFDANWLEHFDRTQSTGLMTQTIHGAGNYDLGALPEFKANLSAQWNYKGWGAGGVGRFVGSFKECGTPGADSQSSGGLCYVAADVPSRDVGTNVVLDLHASYSFGHFGGGNMSIAVGVNNVFDQAPQYVYSAALANSDPSVYDYLGRYFYTRIKENF